MKRIFSITLISVSLLLLVTVGFTVYANAGSDISISASHETGEAGDTVEVLLNLDSNNGFSTLNLYFTYPSELELVSFTNSVPSLVCTNDMTVLWDGGSDYTGTGTLAVLKFKIPDDAQAGTKYDIGIHFIEAFDSEYNDVTASLTNGSITVASSPENCDLVITGSKESAKAGDTVDIILNIDKNNGFSTLNLYFTYPSELELVSLTNSVPSLVCTNDMTVLWDGGTDYTETGALAVLRFKIPEDAIVGTEYDIGIHFVEAFDSEYNDVTVSLTNASVTVAPPPVNHNVCFIVESVIVKVEQIEDGKTVTKPADPTVEGKRFLGWYYEDGTLYDFSAPVTGLVCIIAKFESIHVCSGTLVKGKAATCTENGWNDYYECSCGKYYTEAACVNEILDIDAWKIGAGKLTAPGHKPGTDWVFDEATHWKECSCGARTETAQHKFTTLTVEPQVGAQGYTVYTCSCGYSYKDNYTNPLPDVDSDGDVDEFDAEAILKYIAGWDVDVNEAALDVNGDGKVNVRDAAAILLYVSQN